MTGEPSISVKTYLIVFVGLLLLLFLTVGLAAIPTHGHEHMRDLLTVVGFTIAAIKGVMIILWFMHVKLGSRLTWVFSSAAFAWLVIMMVLTLNDYWTRGSIPGAGKAMPAVVEPGGHAEEYRPEDSTGLQYKR
jgi:cytochrome c oxidase subunit 4